MVAKAGSDLESARTKSKILVILDVNGTLLVRTGTNKKNQKLRKHLDVLLSTLDKLKDRVIVGVWSSMMEHNLYPALHGALGQERTDNLAFIFDQAWCTHTRVKGMQKPLLRKDLFWLKQTRFANFMPKRVLLIDDDAIKCTKNPPGTAIHPSAFTGQVDDELLALSAYLENLASADCTSVSEYVLANPYIPCGSQLEISDGDHSEEEEVQYVKNFDNASSPNGYSPGEEQEAEDEEMFGEFVQNELPPAKRVRTRDPLFLPGARIEAYWPDDDMWLPAKVICIQSDGDVQIAWEADCTGSTVPTDYLRCPRASHARR